MKRRTKRQKAIIRRRIFVCSVLAVIVAVGALFYNACGKPEKKAAAKENAAGNVSETETTKTVKNGKTVTATVINTGDIILHDRIFKDAPENNGVYDFSDFFKVANAKFKAADYAVANLEVTLAGPNENKQYHGYSGYPAFNSPDCLLDYIKDAGIDLLLTANNHSYDTGLAGLKRTVQKVKEYGFEFIGTKEAESDHTYVVKDINGIKIGMVCYTYETKSAADGRKTLNGNVLSSEAQNLVNSFDYNEIDSFYADAQSVISGMKNDGADAVVFYIHWGEEYQRSPNTWQKAIAQKLCNMGVDVIVGGHPHVLQPVEILHAEGSDKTTVCAYSLGNAISNQRRDLIKSSPNGHTEDGALFSYTFTKTPDGVTTLTAVDFIPTWLDKYSVNGKYRYTMYPIDNADTVNSYGLGAATVAKLKESYERSKAVVAKGLTECQQELGCEVRFKD